MDTSHSLGICTQMLQPKLCLVPRDAALVPCFGWRDSGDAEMPLVPQPIFFTGSQFSRLERFWWPQTSPRVDKQQLDTLEAQDMRSEEWMCYTRQPEHTAGTRREQLSLTTPCREQTAAPGQGKKRKITISRAVA